MSFLKKIYNRLFFKRAVRLPKRFRIVFSTLVLTSIFLVSTFFYKENFILFLFLLAVSAYVLTYFSILEGIERVEWFMLFITPVFTVVSLYLFYYLFPIRWLTRLPFLFIFGISVYSNILSSNILNVGVEKALQLYRAAFSTNFLFQSIVIFLLSTVVFSLSKGPLFNFLIVFLTIFPLALQFVWSIRLNLSISKEDVKYALFLSLIPVQVAFLFSLSPIFAVAFGILVSAFYYYCAGYIYLVLEKKLFPETLREFNFVLIIVIIFLLLSIRYG